MLNEMQHNVNFIYSKLILTASFEMFVYALLRKHSNILRDSFEYFFGIEKFIKCSLGIKLFNQLLVKPRKLRKKKHFALTFRIDSKQTM